MINKNLKLLGSITKTYSNFGALFVKSENDLPENLEQQKCLLLLFENQYVPFFLREGNGILSKSKNSVALHFDAINHEREARELVNCQVFMELANSIEDESDELDINDLTNFLVVDKTKGEIGKVAEIIKYPGNTVLSIISGEKEILIPLHRNFIKRINRKKQIINIDAPEGLIDMYLE